MACREKMTVARYFRDGAAEIADTNLSIMHSACLLGSAATLLLLIVTPYIIPVWSITAEYYFLIPILMLFYVFSLVCGHKGQPAKPLTVELACALLFTLVFADLVAISVFPYPASPQIFITVSFLVLPVIFIQRPWVIAVMELAGEAAFLFLAFKFKTPDCAASDTFNSLTGMLFSMLTVASITRLRLRDYQTRCRLKALSMTDSLTGLLNKGAFESACEAWLSRRREDGSCALLVMDLDDFKQINDTYGHRCGDELLQYMGTALRGMFRQTDFLGRVGGDEFCVYMNEAVPQEELDKRLEAIRGRLALFSYGGKAIGVGCSGGVAFGGPGPLPYDLLFARADAALYTVKNRSKGGFAYAAAEK